MTQILAATGLTPDFSTFDPETLDAAQRRGTAVHEAIAGEHYGYTVDLAQECVGWMDAYRKFCAETQHVPLVSEYEVISNRWRYVGHLDRVGTLNLNGFTGRRTVIDFKSGGGEGAEIQLAAYAMAWNEQHPDKPVERACVVQLRGDGTYRVHPVDWKQPMAHGFTPEAVWYSAVTLFHARGGGR